MMNPRTFLLLAGILLSVPGAAEPFAYITNLASNDVSVIDLETRSVVDTVAVGLEPLGVAVTSDAGRIYVANSVSDDVSVIDTANHQVIATIPVGDLPLGIAVSPDDTTIYVGCQEPGLWILDAAGLSVVDTLPLDPLVPQGVAVSLNGQHVYVTSIAPPALWVIDAATRTVVESLDLGGVGVTVGRAVGSGWPTRRTTRSTCSTAPASTSWPCATPFASDAWGGVLATLGLTPGWGCESPPGIRAPC